MITLDVTKEFKINIVGNYFILTEQEAFDLYQELSKHFNVQPVNNTISVWDSERLQKAMKEGPSCG